MKLFKHTKTLILSLLLLCLVSTSSYALEIINREDINMDETLSVQADIYSSSSEIYISQLKGYNKISWTNPVSGLEVCITIV